MTSGTVNTLFGISCPSSTICYAVGAAGTIIKSTDGGVNWTTQTSNTANALGGISCPSTTVCYAAGVNGTVDKTSDGSTWAVQTSNTSAQLNSLHCASTTLCVAVGNSGTIIRTGDGTTWSAQSSGTTSPLLGAFVADSSNHLVVGGNASASSHKGTSNGGSTWATQYLGTSAALSYLSCFSSSLTNCLATGSTSFLRTTAGLNAWNLEKIPSTSSTYYGSVCPTASLCYAVGTSGSIFKGQ